MRSGFVWILGLTLVSFGIGCGSTDDVNKMGTEGSDCYPNNTCNSGLVCLSKTCVEPPHQNDVLESIDVMQNDGTHFDASHDATTPPVSGCTPGSTRYCETGCGPGLETCLPWRQWGDCQCPTCPCNDGWTCVYNYDYCVNERVFHDVESNLDWQDPPAPNFYQVGCGGGYRHAWVSWQVAKEYCGNLTWAGRSGWRLPSIDELRSLVRECPATMPGGACKVSESCPSISCHNNDCHCALSTNPYWPAQMHTDGGGGADLWSSTPNDIGDAWGLDFGGAWIQVGSQDCDSALVSGLKSIRCVRDHD